MSLMPLFSGRKSYAPRVQNPPHPPTTTITHRSQKKQGGLRYDSPTKVTHQFQTNRGEHDLYYPPTTIFTDQSQTNQKGQNLYDPQTKTTTQQSQPSQGQQDPYYPSHEFYLETPRSLIAPALSFPHEPPSLAPIEYKATPEAHVFKANLHGYKKEEVKVQVEDDRVLKITGEKKIVPKGYDNWHHFQRRIGKFSTAFDLPEDARADKVKSTMENGVLIITIPKKGTKKAHVRTVRIF